MSNIGQMVARLIEAGCDPAAAACVVAEAFCAGKDAAPLAKPVDEAAERRRAADRERARVRRLISADYLRISADVRVQQGSPSTPPSSSPPHPPNNYHPSTPSNSELRSDAGASRDIRADLFGKGLQTLARITGKTPDSCRSLVGRWLKTTQDEAIHVLGAIEDADRNRVADPVAWINRTLLPRAGPQGKRTVQQAADDLLAKLKAFDEPAPGSNLLDGTRETAVRLLPSR